MRKGKLGPEDWFWVEPVGIGDRFVFDVFIPDVFVGLEGAPLHGKKGLVEYARRCKESEAYGRGQMAGAQWTGDRWVLQEPDVIFFYKITWDETEWTAQSLEEQDRGGTIYERFEECVLDIGVHVENEELMGLLQLVRDMRLKESVEELRKEAEARIVRLSDRRREVGDEIKRLRTIVG
ncbi:MAG: hypothetical protein D6812_11905 [Deltaproteobacteria bacterium]|nr:MAG: hypothetical protein D6812_11905 [Deltaproteobacteria bacterium]